MKLCVWRTGHEIADKVANAVLADNFFGKDRYENDIGDAFSGWSEKERMPWMDWADLHIAYGILRGTSDIFRVAQAMGKPFICIDRGYWKPGHYDGYYRIGMGGTQQTTGLDKLEPDYERWDRLGLEILPTREYEKGGMVCPPTDAVKQFFNLPDQYSVPVPDEWRETKNMARFFFRAKDSDVPLQDDLDRSQYVCTFNSSIGWEALRQGIPCISDENHSFVGAYQKQFDISPHLNIDSRRRMFAVMSGLQLNLEEIRQGKLWALIQKLLNASSVTTAGKPLLQMSSQAL